MLIFGKGVFVMKIYDVRYHDLAYWVDNFVQEGEYAYCAELHLYINKEGYYVALKNGGLKQKRLWVFSGCIPKSTCIESDNYLTVKRRRFFIKHYIKAEIQHLYRKYIKRV